MEGGRERGRGMEGGGRGISTKEDACDECWVSYGRNHSILHLKPKSHYVNQLEFKQKLKTRKTTVTLFPARYQTAGIRF